MLAKQQKKIGSEERAAEEIPRFAFSEEQRQKC